MPRIARVVVPGFPHHVTQRGNRRQQTFFCDEDYQAYIDLTAEWCRCRGIEVWAYGLMPNHVHLIPVPSSADGLRLVRVLPLAGSETSEDDQGCPDPLSL